MLLSVLLMAQVYNKILHCVDFFVGAYPMFLFLTIGDPRDSRPVPDWSYVVSQPTN
jgi:hypothetical protein